MKKLATLVALSLIAHGHAAAGPGYYLVSIYENEGEKTVDFRLWNVKIPGLPAQYAPEIGFGYGVTGRWYTELYLTWLRTGHHDARLDDLSWQNDYLLTQGQYPFDLALHSEVKRFRDSSLGYGVEFGPALRTDFGRTQVNANIFFERSYHSKRANRMQMKYQWQIKQRWRPAFQFGLQGFGELGDWDDWAPRHQQSHRMGPVVAGTVPLGGSQELKYEAAYFTGKIFATHAKTFSMRMQYAF